MSIDAVREWPFDGQTAALDGTALEGVLNGVRISKDEFLEWPWRAGSVGALVAVDEVVWLAAAAADVDAPAFTSGTRTIEPGRALAAVDVDGCIVECIAK